MGAGMDHDTMLQVMSIALTLAAMQAMHFHVTLQRHCSDPSSNAGHALADITFIALRHARRLYLVQSALLMMWPDTHSCSKASSSACMVACTARVYQGFCKITVTASIRTTVASKLAPIRNDCFECNLEDELHIC